MAELERVRKDLDAVGVVEQFPRLEGRQMVMVLAPKKKVTLVKPKVAKPKADKPKAEAKKVVEKPAQA